MSGASPGPQIEIRRGADGFVYAWIVDGDSPEDRIELLRFNRIATDADRLFYRALKDALTAHVSRVYLAMTGIKIGEWSEVEPPEKSA